MSYENFTRDRNDAEWPIASFCSLVKMSYVEAFSRYDAFSVIYVLLAVTP